MRSSARWVVFLSALLALSACDGATATDDAGVGSDAAAGADGSVALASFPAVDTGLSACYGETNREISCPAEGDAFYGQDSQYETTPPSYSHDASGEIVNDLNTQLMWERAHHDARLTNSAADAACEALSLGGHEDWRLPTIRELFSLADFRGTVGGELYLDAAFFDLELPTDLELTGTHSYEMMGQTWSSTERPDNPSLGHYFFNFLDGHIKSAPEGATFEMFYRCVRGRDGLPENAFGDNTDGSISDSVTGLTWQQDDGGQHDWEGALSYCEGLSLAGHDDWRLPNVKELQSIVDYSRVEPSLDTDFFSFDQVAGTGAFFWSSTSMINYPDWATYVCFGPCLSQTGMDIHGPGAQRADPKLDNGMDFSMGVGDQRDVVQIQNYVRCVR